MRPEFEQFRQAYASLNAAQKDAVDTIEGPVMVIAGPGTGKTQILTLRIANILLKTDTNPENILALTFTESGANAMRDRLRDYIGAQAYRVNIHTFHGFSGQLIQNYPNAYARVIGGIPASDLDKIAIIESILDGNDIKILRPLGKPSYYVPHILRMLSILKREYITSDKFAKIIGIQEQELLGIEKIHIKGAHKGKVRGEYTKKEKSIEKNKELLHVYRRYEALLNDKNLFDFEDMIVETVKALEINEDMLLDLQETYQYVLADEHQDVNGSQNKLLELLASYHDSPNVFVVGDEKQAIFRFQGASLENFLYFEDVFTKTKTIALTSNYRSGQKILNAAHSLVSVSEGPLKDLRVELKSKKVKQSVVSRREFSHQAVEDSWVVEELEREIKSGVPLEEIAVIVRTNREVEQFSALIRKTGIPAAASADGDILKHSITISARALIDAVAGGTDESALFTVLHAPYWGISHNDLFLVTTARNYSTSLISILSDKDKLRTLGVKDIDAVYHVSSVLESARKKETSELPHRVFEYLLQESGFLDYLITVDPLESVRVIRRLYDEIEALVHRDGVGALSEVGKTFEKRQAYGLPLLAPYIATNTHAVQVMTAHKSKGLEFTTVFIPHLIDNLWGGIARRTYFDVPLTKHIDASEFDEIDDERRLLYVAMTRSKKNLHLSSAKTNTEGKKLAPSRLFDDIDSKYLLPVATEKEEDKFDPVVNMLKKNSAVSIDAQLLTKFLSERGLSATSLNNYLRSPWDYFYRNVLRIPEVQPVYMLFGTVMHKVLEKVTSHHTVKQKIPSDSEVKKLLERELSRLSITKEEYVRLHEKGYSALLSYLSHITPSLPAFTKEEFSLRVMLPTGMSDFPELPLTGKLDRLDFDDGKVVRVIDYKTGKPRTRNVIEGNTANSDGDYKRQLIFYALLLSLYDNEKYVCREVMLSFVEADGKGVIHEELFTITEEEIEALKSVIIETAREIVSGEFLKHPCDSNKSSYCDLAEILQSRGDGLAAC